VNGCKTVAVIGAGISGLAAAWLLSRKYEVWVLERADRIGGHTNTAKVQSSTGTVAVDTGFIVHNEKTYPLFCRLMQELGVATQASDMSFGVSTAGGRFEYSSRGLKGFFAQWTNWLRPRHYGLLLEILRFNREAPKFLLGNEGVEVTLGAFLLRGKYSKDFIEQYLYPMSSAVWSMPQNELAGFPARTLLGFFQNHGMLGINTHPRWKTITGGSDQYLGPMTEPYKNRILTGAGIRRVSRTEPGVTVDFEDRPAMQFDHVVFACHGNQILPLLQNPTETERSVLQNFQTSRNEVCLHTDETLLPQRLAARASWNYRIGKGSKTTMTYDMNRLQNLATQEQYCVSLNSPGAVRPGKAIQWLEYYHPVYNVSAVKAQQRWAEISGVDRVHYCGAYWFYGFHEDGVRSAVRVAEALGVQW